MKKYLLGIDVGTTGTKTLLFSEDGNLIAHAYRGYPLSTPKVGFSEQNSEDWWNAIVETVRETCNKKEISDNIAAISLSTQGGTIVPVDENNNALRPAIVWNDTRGTKEKEAFLKEVGDDDVMYGLTGWHLCNKLPAIIIRWLKENEPETFSKTNMFLSVPDYVSMKMTGIPAVDLSNAGINQLCNIKLKTYDKKLLEFAGIDETKLAKLVPSGEKIGKLTEKAAKELNISPDAVLVSGAHDQYAVALGAGAINDGDIMIGSGTCWVVTAIGNEPDFESKLSQSISAVKDKWGSLQSLSSGGVCLDWLRKSVSSEDLLPYNVIDSEVLNVNAATEGLYFYPFAGKCGDQQRLTRASFIGLDLSHNKINMALAVMEGVVFQVLWMMEDFKTKPSENGIILSGGASKSPAWSQLLSDISGLPVRIPAVADLACVGAAILAGAGAKIYSDVNEGYNKLAVKEKILYPDTQKTAQFAPILADYKEKAKLLK